jgi:SAM-dependent methyltransferase
MGKNALHFDDNFEIYDNVRPGYPKEVYETISKHIKLNKDSNILEIGAGNGIASQEIYNRWSPKLTLLEPGNNLVELLYRKFKLNKDITIKNTAFEKYESKIFFDAVFSATAFHWLDMATKYKKTYGVLKKDGLLILYWNNYGIENNEMENKIQKIYTRHGNGISDGRTGYERQMEKIEKRRMEIEGSKYFKVIEHKIIKTVKEYNADDYIKLLKTFPDHLKMGKNFFDEVKEEIKKENKIGVKIIVNLEIANKI